MSKAEYPLVIGLTGPFGSGCNTVAKILEEKHYNYIKVSDFIKEECRSRSIDISKLNPGEKRAKLQDIGDDLRNKEKGGTLGYLIEKAFEKIDKKEASRYVINSIKNPGEITEFKKHPNTYVIAISASFDKRYERMWQKEPHYKDRTLFEQDDKRDQNEKLDYGQNVQECVNVADLYIENNNTVDMTTAVGKDELVAYLMQYIDIIEKPGSRSPTYPELMMNNAYCISLLSDCIERQVGAIISVPVDDKQYIVATGYNGVPQAQDSCKIKHGKCSRSKTWDKVFAKIKYCPNCGNAPLSIKDSCSTCKVNFKDYAPSRKALDICRALHAEESAILQAARLGTTSLKGSTLYTTTFPCLLCAKKIIASGIKKVVWLEAYPAPESKEMLEKAGIKLEEFKGVKARAFYELFEKREP
ncbi:MAG: deaminase [bacterium]|nr:deaminase [bacterium]